MSVAVCLLTADRLDYTAITLASFAAMNDRHRFKLFHADDASTDARVPALAQSYGFKTLFQAPRRLGWLAVRRTLFERAARHAEWILFLENDHEWVRPFPWTLFDFIVSYPQFYCLRLYGRFKGRDGIDPAMEFHKRGPRLKPVKWKPIKKAPEPCQVGVIHWSAQPSVTRAAELIAHHRSGLEPHALTARVVENVTCHIGARRTGPRQLKAMKALERAS